jgi:hypothetical protein
MKKLYFLFFLLGLGIFIQAQPARPEKGDNRSADLRKIQAMEMAFITKELNLSPDEAQKFWPLFNQYRSEIKGVSIDRKSGDHLDRQQKVLDLRKKYREDFTKVMTHERANKVFGAEDEFKSLVRREFQKRQSEKRQFEGRKKGF